MAYHRLGDYIELLATGQRLVDAADPSDPEQRFRTELARAVATDQLGA